MPDRVIAYRRPQLSAGQPDNLAGCQGCRAPLGFDFTFAFQPIVDLERCEIYAYEALVRGPEGQGAAHVLAQLTDDNRYRFDQECRRKSILLAKQLGMTSRLSINFLPNAVYQPELCLRTTIAAAEQTSFPLERIIFEVAESEHVMEPQRLLSIFRHYHERGFLTALDDFGAGYAGLGLLTQFQPQLLKLDMQLVRHADHDPVKQAVLEGLLLTAAKLGIEVIAEGVETAAEAHWFRAHGVHRMQGYYFARPGVESLPRFDNWGLD